MERGSPASLVHKVANPSRPISQALNSVSNFDLAPGLSCSLFALIQRPLYVSHWFHLAYTQESLAFFLGRLWFCGFGLVCVSVVFVVWFLMQETLSKTAQADLCISCMTAAPPVQKGNV